MFAASKTSAAAAGAPPGPSTDPQFNYVTMLLHGDGTNGAQNNTFVDSSTNNFTITRNGTPTQGSFSPYGDLWSNYINGSATYFSIATNTAFAFGSGDFTVEAWIYDSGTTSAYAQIIGASTYGVANEFLLSLNASTRKLYAQLGNPAGGNSTGNVSANTWTHVALVRSGTTLTFYINGTASGSSTNTNSVTSTITVTIGAASNNNADSRFVGYVSNLRVVKGTALYTSNFTPSTTPLTAVSGTSLLTCQSNRFRDNSSNNFAITVTGTPSVQRFSPFEPSTGYDTSVIGGSGYFSGSGQYLSFTGTNAAFQFGTSDWTVECWVCPTVINADQYVWDFRPSANGAYPAVDMSSTGFKYVANAAVVITGTTAPKVGVWYHVAVARSGTSTKLFVNGVQEGSTYTDSTNYTVAANRPYIGIDSFSGSSFPFTGYIANLRMLKGTALYTTTFTPPTAPLTAITNTSLLLNCVNAGIFDNAMMNDLVTVGDAKVGTAVKKYGTGSMKFDGSGDYLLRSFTSTADPMYLSGRTFTVEAWVYMASTSGVTIIYDCSAANTGSFGALSLFVDTGTAGFQFRPTTGGTNTIVSGGTVPTNTWTHLAFSVNTGSGRLFINGTQVGSTTTFPTAASFTPVGGAIGRFANGYITGINDYNGYIDDLRITQGIARYTANFTPPTAALPNN